LGVGFEASARLDPPFLRYGASSAERTALHTATPVLEASADREGVLRPLSPPPLPGISLPPIRLIKRWKSD